MIISENGADGNGDFMFRYSYAGTELLWVNSLG